MNVVQGLDCVLETRAGRKRILVEDKVVVEVKCVDGLNDVHFAQALTYVKLGNHKLGLLLNFNVVLLKDGIRRIANGL